MPLLTPEQVFAERMSGGADYAMGDLHVRSTRSVPLSGAAPATLVRNGPSFLPDVPSPLPSGVGGYLLESVDAYDSVGGPWLLYEPVNLGSLDCATGIFTPGVPVPTRTLLGVAQQPAVQVLVEMATDMTSTRTIVVNYTNQDGISGKLSASHAITVNALKNSQGVLVLAAGDTGVREIASVAVSGGTSPAGTINFVGMIPLVLLPTTTVGVSKSCNLLAEGIVRRLPAGGKVRASMFGSAAAARSVGVVNYVCDPLAGAAVGSVDPLRSITDIMEADAKYGTYPESANVRHTPATAGGLVTAGRISMQTWDRNKPVPAYHASLDGVVVSNYRATFAATVESYLLYRGATLGGATISAGSSTFVPGSAMPSRRYSGKALAQQLSADMPALRITTNLGGGSVATVTIDYTNQDGVGGRTAQLVLNTNPIAGSSWLITPHLQGTDTGIQSVQNVTVTGVNTGAMEVVGYKVLANEMHYTSTGVANVQAAMPKRHLILQTGDLVNVSKLGTAASTAGFATWDYLGVNKP